MHAINILAAAVASLRLVSASVQVVGYLGNACNGEELFGDTLASGKCVSVANIESSHSITVSGLTTGRVNFYYGDHCTDEVAHTTFDECYLEGSRVNSIMYKK